MKNFNYVMDRIHDVWSRVALFVAFPVTSTRTQATTAWATSKAWLKLGGAVVLDKVGGFYLYYVLFPMLIHLHGWIGVAEVMAIQFSLSGTLLVGYNAFCNDFLDVDKIQESVHKKGVAIRQWLGLRGESKNPRLVRFLNFIFLAWQLMPFLVVILTRHNRERSDRKDLRALFLSSVFGTLWWSSCSFVIVWIFGFTTTVAMPFFLKNVQVFVCLSFLGFLLVSFNRRDGG